MSGVESGVVHIAAFLVAAGVLLRALSGSYKFVRRLNAMHDVVVRELQPNGGSSLRDAVSRIDVRVQRVESFCDELRQRDNPAS